MSIDNNTLYLRKASEEDCDILYQWANDPVTRKNSFSTDQIGYSEHCNWFSAMMKNENRIQYILMQRFNNKEKAIGQIRLDVIDNIAEISYSISPKERGKGYGKQMLKLISQEASENCPNIMYLTGQVKPDNISSARAFINQGFVETFRQYELKITHDNGND